MLEEISLYGQSIKEIRSSARGNQIIFIVIQTKLQYNRGKSFEILYFTEE